MIGRAGHHATGLDHVGVVRCGKALRKEHHPPHTFVFQASDDSPERVEGDCPGWSVESYAPRCPVHTGTPEPCPTCSAYIAAGL